MYISFAKESGKNDFGRKCSISYKRFVYLFKFYDYIEYKTVVFMYRVKFGLVSTNIISLFDVEEDNRYETRQRGNFVQLYLHSYDNEGHVFVCCW